MNSNNNKNKLHYKMYKSGKKWIIAGIFTITAGTSIILNNNTASADSVHSTQNNISSNSNSNSDTTLLKNSEVSSFSNVNSVDSIKDNKVTSDNNSQVDKTTLSSDSSIYENSDNSSNISNYSSVSSVNNSKASTASSVNDSKASTASSVNDSKASTASSVNDSKASATSSVNNSNSNTSESNSDQTKLNDTNASISSSAKSTSSDTSTPEDLMNNTVLNQNFHYNVPRGYSNDVQTILPHKNSDGQIDYYDVYYLYNPDPNQIGFADEWYHARTTDFKTFTPYDQSDPTGVNNVAIPDPDYKDSNGNSTQVASNNKNGIPWGYAATGTVMYNNGMISKDQWNNSIDSDAKLAYFTDLNSNGQTIFLAYSNNDQQFHPYSDKPVISGKDLGIAERPGEFRDISIDRLSDNSLVGYVAGAYTSKMYVVTSKDGVNWSYNPSNDITLGQDGVVEVETPIVKYVNGQAFMFYSWHEGDNRANAAINGVIDSNGIFKTTSDSKIVSVDGVPYKGDTYAGNYTNIDNNTLVNINWSGNWNYSPLGVGNSYNYFTMHGGSFALPRLVQNNNGQLQYVPVEPNNELIGSYKTSNNGSSDFPILVNTNNKLDFSFGDSSSSKTINLKRNGSNVTISIDNGTITVNRENSINPKFSKSITSPFGVNDLSKLELYVDNSSIELYLPESNQTYNIVNFSTKQNEPYKMTVNADASIDNYDFNNSYQSLSTSQVNTVINNLSSNVNNDVNVSKSLSSIVSSYSNKLPNDSDYASLSVMLSNANESLSSASTSISIANSYNSIASSMSNDVRSNLYLTLASSAYASASNAENHSIQSIMSARNSLAAKSPNASELSNGKQVINGHNVMFIDGKQVSGQIYTDSNGQSHYYDSINGYEGINLFYLDNGKYYYFDEDGNMVKNKFISAIPNTNYDYYFGNDGVAVNGNQTINGKSYLFNNGIQVKDTMIINSDNTFSYYDDNGLIINSSASINGQSFNFDSNGKLIAPNQFIKNLIFPGTTYYLNENNQISKGFQDINGDKYYFDNNGNMVTNQYEMDGNGNFYRFGNYGKALVGKQVVDYTKRYFNSNGVQVKDAAVIDSNGKLSFYDAGDGNPIDKVNTEDGKSISADSNDNIIAPNTFIVSPLNSNEIYHLDNSSQVTKGFADIDGSKYYFDNNGIMLISGSVNDDNGNVYNANSNGILVLKPKETNNNSSSSNSSSSANSSNNSSNSSSSANSSNSSSNSSSSVNSSNSSSNSSSSVNTSTNNSNSQNNFLNIINVGNSNSTSNVNASTNYYVSASSSTSTVSNSNAVSSNASLGNSSASSSNSSSSVSSTTNEKQSSSSEISDIVKSAKNAMIKARAAVKFAEKNKQKSHSKKHVNNYNKALDNYYNAETNYLKKANLYNNHYYYNFDKVTQHSKYVKLNKLAFVYNSKKFTEENRVSKLKRGTKVKVNKIVRNGNTTRFNIGHNKFITGLKSFIHKLTK